MNKYEYNILLKPYSRALQQLLLELNFFMEDIGNIIIFSITHRLKTFESSSNKSQKLGIDINKLQDLAGLRVVAATRKEIDIISRFFSRQEIGNDLKISSDKQISREDGYRARHIIINLAGSYKRSMHPIQIEIQLQTIFEHAYNFISHAWVYKTGKNYSSNWKTDFINLSKKLDQLDQEILDLHNEVIESSLREGDDEPLSPFSYQKIVESTFKEEVEFNDAVDSCRFCTDLGYNTNGKLKSFFNNPEIHKLREYICSISDPQLQQLKDSFIKIPLNMFWSLAGTRISGTYELINNFKKFENDNIST